MVHYAAQVHSESAVASQPASHRDRQGQTATDRADAYLRFPAVHTPMADVCVWTSGVRWSVAGGRWQPSPVDCLVVLVGNDARTSVAQRVSIF
jgi:transcriptional regulator GlxA family with amidase domain